MDDESTASRDEDGARRRSLARRLLQCARGGHDGPSSAIHISRDRFHLAWDPRSRRSRRVPSGSEVEFDLLDASGGQLTRRSTVADIATLDFSRVDQVNGPIAVEGAEPGDVLQIDLLEFEPADWGWTASIPGFGLLADDFTEPAYRVTSVPGVGERAEFLPGVRAAGRPVLRRARRRARDRARGRRSRPTSTAATWTPAT